MSMTYVYDLQDHVINKTTTKVVYQKQLNFLSELSVHILQDVLFGTVNELKLVGSFKRCLNTGIGPQLLCVFIELLQHTRLS